MEYVTFHDLEIGSIIQVDMMIFKVIEKKEFTQKKHRLFRYTLECVKK